MRFRADPRERWRPAVRGVTGHLPSRFASLVFRAMGACLRGLPSAASSPQSVRSSSANTHGSKRLQRAELRIHSGANATSSCKRSGRVVRDEGRGSDSRHPDSSKPVKVLPRRALRAEIEQGLIQRLR